MKISISRPTTQTSKPVTPKTLFMLSSGQATAVTPNRRRFSPLSTEKKAQKEDIKTTKIVSPLPDFMKEYLVNEEKPKKVKRKLEVCKRMSTAKPSYRTKKEFEVREESPFEATQEVKVFRIYKPQIINISPRSKMKLYSTVKLVDGTPLKRIEKVSFNFKKNLKPVNNSIKSEEVSVSAADPVEYLRPALTFGEKLWRLNEVSIFNNGLS